MLAVEDHHTRLPEPLPYGTEDFLDAVWLREVGWDVE